MFHYHEKDAKRRVSVGARSLRNNLDQKEPQDKNSVSNGKNSQTKVEKRLRTKFLKADVNGNGWLEENELRDLLKELHLEDENGIDVTSALQEDGRINFRDFCDLVQPLMIINEEVSQDDVDGKPIKKTDKNENEQKEIDNQATVQDRIKFTKIVKKHFLKKQASGLQTLVQRTINHLETSELPSNDSNTINELGKKEICRTLSSQDQADITDYVEERWNAFINFKRSGKGGEIVMTSDEQLTDALPGTYDLLQLVMEQFDSDILTMKPKHAVIKPVKWISAKKNEKHGQLLCPKYWNCTIPVELGTEQNLSYYGCSYASKQQQTVALLHRHATVDFCYSENYKRNYVLAEEEGSGGCGLEMHAFHHMDCPLDNDSGYFLLGKIFHDEELHITAFKIPKHHVLYVPPMIIHSNDHMLGTWRTMLADNVPIDHVHFMKETSSAGYYDNVEVAITDLN